MPSIEWLQKHQSSSSNIRKKRKSCLLHTHCLAQQVPSAKLGWGYPDLLHLGAMSQVRHTALSHNNVTQQCPRSGTQHSQLRQAELSPERGFMTQYPMVLQYSCYRRLWVPLGYMMAPGGGAGPWKRDPSRHINIMILHPAWEILLSVPVGHSVGSGTFGMFSDQRC